MVIRKSFPADGAVWRVDWFGRVRKNPHVASEFLVEVAMSRLAEPSPGRSWTAPQRGAGNSKVIPVGVGAIPDLRIGSLWQDGIRLPPPAYETFDEDVSLDPADIQLIQAGTKDESAGWVIPLSRYPLPDGTLGAPCVAVKVGDDPYGLIIPCAEVLRAWWLRSTTMALRLFSGPLNSVLAKIYDPARSMMLGPTRMRVQLRPGLSRADAWPAAMLANSPYAQRTARAMFDHVMSTSYMGRNAWIRMLPPVPGRVRIRARGIAVVDRPRRFLVFDLIAVPYPADVTQVVFDVDNDGSTAGSAGVAKPSEGGRPTGFRRPVRGDSLTHDDEPNIVKGSTVEDYDAATIISSATVERALRQQTSGSGPPSQGIETTPEARPHSTGLGVHSDTGLHRLRYVANGEKAPVPPAAPAGLGNGLALVGALRAIPGTGCSLVSVGSPRAKASGTYSSFPSRSRIGKRSKIPWSYLDGRLRRALVLEISHEGRRGYVFEFERRPDIPGGSFERFRLALISSASFEAVGMGRLNGFLRTCAMRRGVWPKELRRHRLQTFIHGRSPEKFALVVVNQLRKWAGIEGLIRDPEADEFVARSWPKERTNGERSR